MSQIKNPGVRGSILATGAIRAKRCIGVAGAEAGAGAPIVGVSTIAFDSGEMACYECTGGIVSIETGGAFIAGDQLKSDAQGRAVFAAAGTAAPAAGFIATAYEASTAAGQFARALLR